MRNIYPAVSSLLWEIRRERRIELSMEGFRHDDLIRWKKLEYSDTEGKDTNRGAWIKRSDYPSNLTVTIEDDAEEGYIIPVPNLANQKKFVDPRVYLSPIGLDQIKLYKDNNVDLVQNPGW